MSAFKNLGLKETLLKAIEEKKFDKPSEIQEKSIPLVLAGKDIIGQAATGSGKTLAFGAGIIGRVQPEKGVQALVLTPTRELAEQVANSLKEFSKYEGLFIQDVYGGVDIDRQVKGIQRAEVVVGTPGRILDHLERRTLDLSKVDILVLDEADRMVDMGFLPDVERIIQRCENKKQMLMFSATLSMDIEYIAKKYMHHAQHVEVASYVDASRLKQVYYDVQPFMKLSLLVHLLKHDPTNKVMIFCNTRSTADFVAKNLEKQGLKVFAIHGGLSQNKRNYVLEGFHTGEINILVCTDVAARGLDIKDVTHVYNYDIPKNSTEYIHRIGRTARAGREGEAISIVTSNDYDSFRKVLEDEQIKIDREETPKFEPVMAKFDREGRDRGHSRDGDRGRSRGGGYGRGRSGGGGRHSGGRGGSHSGSGGRRDSRGPRRSFGRR